MGIIVSKLIDTNMSYNYINLINSKFNIDILLSNDTSKIMFDNWKSDDNITIIDDINNIILNFDYENNKYTINNKYIIEIPNTVDEFIYQILSCNLNLYWKNNIDKILSPIDYLNKSDIKKYYYDLLESIDKLNELL